MDTSNGTLFSRAVAAINCHDDRTLLHILREKETNDLFQEHGVQLLTAAAEQGTTGSCTTRLVQSFKKKLNKSYYTCFVPFKGNEYCLIFITVNFVSQKVNFYDIH